jgi:DNA-binding MarR family transcriptional regulator
MDQARRTQHRFEVAMDQCLEAYGISYAQYRALEFVLDTSADIHVSELARRLRLSRQSANLTVAKLERAGYVVTEREPHHRYILATAQARSSITLIREMAAIPLALEHELGMADLGSLVGLLRRAERATYPPRRPDWWLAP